MAKSDYLLRTGKNSQKPDRILPVVKVATPLKPHPHELVVHLEDDDLHRTANCLLKQLGLLVGNVVLEELVHDLYA